MKPPSQFRRATGKPIQRHTSYRIISDISCGTNSSNARSQTFMSTYVRSRPSSQPRLPSMLWIVAIFGLMVEFTNGVFLDFENCLSPNRINSNPKQLQFEPLHYWANFNSTFASHNLNSTVYGNVTGQLTQGPYPPPDDPQWSNPNETFGKIVNVDEEANKFTTLFARLNVLSYTPWSDKGSEFCRSTVNTKCPVGPAFSVAP